MINFKFKYIEVHQKIGSFYLTKMTPKQLHTISNNNLSRYENAEEGIQRELSKQKTKQIKKYLKDDLWTFPNTIILAIQRNPESDTPHYFFDDENESLDILAEDGVANVLDGQHRLSGFSESDDEFELPVAIFLDLSIGKQAKIFAKINSTQTKVSLDLVYELFDISKDRSMEKSAFSIVNELNTDINSPWEGKIKTLSDRDGYMAQGSFAKYIHKELIDDGKILEKLYREDRDNDLKIMIKNFFTAVKDEFPSWWDDDSKQSILPKTTGFVGFMFFFKDLVKIARHSGESFTVDFCKKYIDKTKNLFEDFTSDHYESGGKGQDKIRKILRSGLTNEEKDIVGAK